MRYEVTKFSKVNGQPKIEVVFSHQAAAVAEKVLAACDAAREPGEEFTVRQVDE